MPLLKYLKSSILDGTGAVRPSPVLDPLGNDVLCAGGDWSRVHCIQWRRSNGLSIDRCCVQVLTQQQSQLLVFLSEVVLVLPQSLSLQHGAVEPPQQLLQLRELAWLLGGGGRRAEVSGVLLPWRLEWSCASSACCWGVDEAEGSLQPSEHQPSELAVVDFKGFVLGPRQRRHAFGRKDIDKLVLTLCGVSASSRQNQETPCLSSSW